MHEKELNELNRLRDNSMIELNLKHEVHSNQSIERFENNKTPTPILVLYFDIRQVNPTEINEAISKIQQILARYQEHGWLHLIIPVERETKLEIAAIEGSISHNDFETFKQQILKEVNGANTFKTELSTI